MNIYSIFLGMVIFQMIYIVFQYTLFKRTEFIYYFIYTLFVTLYITSKMTPAIYFNWFKTNEEISVIGRGVITVAYGTYFKFGRLFTNSNILYPIFSRQLKYVATFLIFIGSIDIIFQVSGVMPFNTLDRLFNIIHLILVIYSLGVVYYLLRKNNKLTTILVIGSSILVFCASGSLIDSLFITKGMMPATYYASYIELGIIGELLFLNYGLNFKTKLEQKEKTKLEIEKQLTLANERTRISADLHDDVGATLSSMHIYGDLAGAVWDTKPEQSKEMVGKISIQSKELMERMSDIVWSLKSPVEEKNSITTRLRNYTHELLAVKNITVILDIDEELTEKIINPLARKNILLIAKEAINNIAKYSMATESIIKFYQQGEFVVLKITDNGIGFDLNKENSGNGLSNIEQRCKQLIGNTSIDTLPGKGVTLTCSFPIAIISHLG
ncbi:MAG: sensor histidine kinase [Chitinophagaceae bacterium]